MATLTHPQARMLRLLVASGYCSLLTPARHHEAWTVRVAGTVRAVETFAQPTGDALLRMGMIERDPENGVGKDGEMTIRRYVPTEAGRAQADRKK